MVRVRYRFINANSLVTGESLNIGIVTESDDKNNHKVYLCEKYELLKFFFPSIHYFKKETLLQLIDVKYKFMGKSKMTEITITRNTKLSNIKLRIFRYPVSNEWIKKKLMEELTVNNFFTKSLLL